MSVARIFGSLLTRMNFEFGLLAIRSYGRMVEIGHLFSQGR